MESFFGAMSGFGILLAIGYLLLTIFIIIYFFRMANDVRKIKESTNKVPKGNDLAIIKFLDGEKSDAIRIIRETFIIDVITMFENLYLSGDYSTDSEGYKIINKYVWRYKYILPEIDKEYLKEIYLTVEKVYIKE